MDDAKVTAAELKKALAGDFDRMVERIVATMNSAQPGRIIADSEEPVRNANAEFRQRAFEQALSLLQAKQEAFSPSAQRIPQQGAQAGDASDGQRPGDD